MGLDITAYRQVQLAPADIELDEDGHPADWEKYSRPYVNPDFPGRAAGLLPGRIYTTGTEQMGFRAGSYSGYSYWRSALAVLAGFESDQGAWDSSGGPFWELITFSDCEGTVGSAIASKLAKDFAEYDERAKTHFDEYGYERYCSWRAACEMAADGGYISFH